MNATILCGTDKSRPFALSNSSAPSLRAITGSRLWARATSDYSNTFSRIRDAVAALPVDSVVIDGEAVVLRPDNTSDFEALRSRQLQAEAVMVAYDIMSARVTGSSTVGSDPDPHQAPPSAPPASTDDGQWPLRPQ